MVQLLGIITLYSTDFFRIKGLLADREFIGDKWMGWLIEEKIPFNIRIRNNELYQK